jgi:fructose-specific phosphotransferase system IIA component
MNVSELLNENIMELDLKSKTKDEVIDELINILYKNGVVYNKDIFRNDILERERLGTTGIGFGIAIPHAKSKAVKTPSVAFGRSINGIDYKCIDGTKAHLFFMIAVGENDNDLHLRALANLSRLLMHENFREKLYKAANPHEVISITRDMENNLEQ